MFIPEIYQLTNCQIKKVFRTCSAFELYVQDNKCQSQVPQRLGKCKRVETLVKKIWSSKTFFLQTLPKTIRRQIFSTHGFDVIPYFGSRPTLDIVSILWLSSLDQPNQ